MQSIKNQFFEHAVAQKGQQFADELKDILNFMDNFNLTTKKVKATSSAPQCMARCENKQQCSRSAKDGSEFCGLHKPYAKPHRCARCSKASGTDVFHNEKWEHFGRIDVPEIPKKASASASASVSATASMAPEGEGNIVPKKTTMKKPRNKITGYNVFQKEIRPKVKDQYPALNSKEITSKIGLVWKDMDSGARKPYNLIAAKDKERYQREMTEWKAQMIPITPVVQEVEETTSVKEPIRNEETDACYDSDDEWESGMEIVWDDDL